MNLPTYDNAQFHSLLFLFFGAGAVLNAGYGYLSGKTEYLFNGLVLVVLSICTYRLFRIYSRDSKEKVYK